MTTPQQCPGPFLMESQFPETGGFVEGRFCELVANTSCCLPCPLSDWRYADNIAKRVDTAGWISVAILPLCIFLLVSYAVLPVKWTHRHYLSICFTLGICCIQIAFIIPLGARPEQCFNAITPKDMHSDLSCAFSGSLLLFGGWMAVSWSLIRTIAFHLQVCWEVVLGPKFMWGSFLCGFGIPAIGLTVMLVLTGVSFRFGSICHINIKDGRDDYWAPIIAFAGAALIIQVVTMAYCMHIYLRSLFDKTASSENNSSGLHSYTASIRTVSARQAYHRVRRVIQLQWRGVTLVLIILGNVIFFAVVFIKLDRQIEPTPSNLKKASPWLLCLAFGGSREKCKTLAAGLGPNEATLLAMVYLLSLVGFWNFILFARPSMFAGWADLLKRTVAHRHEYISADANDHYVDGKGFEMLTTNRVKSPEPYPMRSPSPAHMAGRMRSPNPDDDRTVHFGQEATYTRPSLSFSGPRAPSISHGREWDPSSTFARSYAR